MRRALLAGSSLLLLLGCATTRAPHIGPGVRIEVLTPMDRVPVVSGDALLPSADSDDLPARRLLTMRTLRGDFADAFSRAGATVCEGDLDVLTGSALSPRALSEIGRADGAEVVAFTEFVAYGTVRRSWLWLLAGQGLVAGIGHGIVVSKATGSVATGWALGAGEFLLEVATWVGGTVFASHVIDPVILRVWAIRSSDGAVLGRWTREGTSPALHWLRRGRPPRAGRLRTVAGGLFKPLAPRVLAKIAASLEAAPGTPERIGEGAGH